METDNKPEKHLEHYLNDLYTQEEANKVLDSIERHENNELLEKSMEKVWEESAFLMDSSDSINGNYKKEASAMLKAENRKYIRLPRKYLRRAVAIAASVIFIFTAGVTGYKYLIHNHIEDILYTEVSTTYGETKTISLPDGTQVTLNSCSDISYPDKFANNERRIKLTGEAYFRVAKNEKQPFIINTGNFNVRVLGTVFNVRAYKGDEIQSVNVESGKVQVDMPDAMSLLSKNEQILINTVTNDYARQTDSNQDVAVWRSGFLHFKKVPVTDVINQLKRIYNYRIVFENGESFDNLISGEHDNQSLEEVLESIRQVTGIKWKAGKHKNEIVLYK